MPGSDEPTSPSVRPGTTTPTSAEKVRDPLLDNARAVLITLVVIGHAIESMDTELANIVYTWIYSFHMPAFVAISGFLTRSYDNEPKQVARLLTGLLVPYLIFQTAHSLEQDLLKGDDISLDLWTPVWTLWFLLALIAWRLLTPALRTLRYPLIFTVTISVLAPLDDDLGTMLSWGRILSFLPFFTLGLLCTPEILAKVRTSRAARAIGAVTLLAALLFAAYTHDVFSTSIFTMSKSYDSREMSALYGVITRVLALATGAVLSAAVIMCVPRRTHWFTVIGRRSLTVYLMHSMILEFPRQLEWFEELTGSGATVLVILAAVLLTLLLSAGPVDRALSWVTSPPIERFVMAPRTLGRR